MEPLLYSAAPLPMDALPALTARFYRGQPALYTQARVYASPQGLHVGIWVFQRQPQPDTRAYFAAAGTAGLLCLQVAPSLASLHALPLAPTPFPGDAGGAPAEAAHFFAGEDEQGWYWGGKCLIPTAALAGAGVPCAPKSVLSCAVFVSQTGMAGASCPLGPDIAPLNPGMLSPFRVAAF